MDIRKIGLIELPSINLYDSDGNDWTTFRNDYWPMCSKQVLISNLRDGGFDVELVNLKKGDETVEFGSVRWKGTDITKTYYGRKIEDLNHGEYDCWGITVNLSMDREVACMLIKHLAAGGKPVVVGGSGAIADPETYIHAGASAVVLDKSGAVNCSIIDYVLGNPLRQKLGKVMLANGSLPSAKISVMSPDVWPLPSVSLARECMGDTGYAGDEFMPSGVLVADIGCDRNCDFCQTSSYKLGYHSMSPETLLRWFEIQKEAGAKSVGIWSDQFAGRLLRAGGRDEIFMLMKRIRELEVPVSWENGLELKKLTLGHGLPDNNDLRPDNELIDTMLRWDGKNGACAIYIPAERPIFGRENYQKLLPWREHCEMIRTIVRTGVPYINYGVIIGFPDESSETLSALEEALHELSQEVMSINPSLKFRITLSTLCPIPGTPQYINMRKSGLLRFDDPSLWGFLTPVIDTHHLSYEEISDWLIRLLNQLGGDAAGNPYHV
ncbi:MAG: radical SAM protein [Desulfobacterales bacterium]|nr:radical SAM protein [Desulfobacterales bacterium]